MLLFPVLFCRAPKPVAVLLLPLALVKRALVPKAVVPAPDVTVEPIHAGSSVRLAGSVFKERLRTIGRVVAGVVFLKRTNTGSRVVVAICIFLERPLTTGRVVVAI